MAQLRLTEQQNEQTLAEYRDRLELALCSANMGSWRWDIPEEALFVDERGCRLLGIDPGPFSGSLEEFFGALAPDDVEVVRAGLQRALQSDAPYEAEYRAVWPNGSTHWVSSRGHLLRDKAGQPLRMNGVLWETTAHKATVAAAGTAETGLETLFAAMPGTIALTRRSDGRFLEANQSPQELTGWSRDQVIGQSSIDLGIWAHAEDRKQFLDALDKEGCIDNFETELCRSDGSAFPALMSASLLEVNGEACVLSAVTDVTALKEVEERVQRLNRVYTVLSKVNQALVRQREPRAIFHKACRALVEDGGFLMAWLGMVASDGVGVEPVASAGDAAGYVENVQAAIDETPRGAGPIGRSIREMRHVVCDDIEQDAAMEPWKESALARGFRAAASFPLIVEGACVGAFVMYAAETGSFNAEQVALLDELAADISFALEFAAKEKRRIAAEDALRASEEKFRAAFQASPDLVSITRLSDGRILEVNEGYEQMLGYTREESIGQTTARKSIWADPADRDHFVQSLQEHGEITGFETRLRAKDGTLVDVLDSAWTVMLDGELCVLSVVRDITERKKAEAEQIRIAAELREAQRVARLGSWDWDSRTDTITWSEEYYRVLGFDPSQAPPGYEEHLNAYTPESAAKLDAAVQKNMATGEPYEVELELAAPQGSTRWILARSETKRDDQGAITGLRGTAQDITERKFAEEQHHAVLATALSGFWITTLDGQLLEVNDAYCAMTGYTEQELLGMRISDLDAVESEAEVAAHASRIVAKGRDRFESKHRRKDGSTFDVECSITYQPDSRRFAVFHRDITARKRREAINRLQGEILEILSGPVVLGESLERVAAAMATVTGLDAVGIRMQEGAEFPYVAHVGFSEEHVLAENNLALRDEQGELCRDQNGELLLECTCGLVLTGKADAALTPGGSFWTNDSEPFLDLAEDDDPRLRPRNLCVREGYRSIALVPIRDRDLIVGLIHLADHRTGAFSAEVVEMLESIAAHIGEALARALSDQQLRHSERRYRLISEAVTGFVYSCVKEPGQPYRVDWIAGALEHLTGYSAQEVLDQGCWRFLVLPEDVTLFDANVMGLCAGQSASAEFRIVARDGEVRWVRSIARASEDLVQPGAVLLVGSCEDITPRKDVEVKLTRALSSTIVALSRTVELRDPYTAGHQQRVAELASAIAQEMAMPAEQIEEIRTAALIHDVGKMSVPAEILSKPARLSDAEFALIRGHSEAGYRIIQSAELSGDVAEIVHEHHERLNGSGYPGGLTSSQILRGAKVLMVADVVEAMTSHRPYRAALGIDAALSEIEAGSGVLYDPDVCSACARLFREERFAFAE